MPLRIGILGLPNVGKSTLFNALVRGHAEASNYAFCTVEPNVGVVQIPDGRLEELERLLQPTSCTPASCRFVDIAGLVRGASHGEGLGNRFLATVRESDALLHVVRCFEDTQVVHVDGAVDPLRDVETVEMELQLADLESVERGLERLDKIVRTDPRSPERLTLAALQKIRAALQRGEPANGVDLSSEEREAMRGFNLLTLKPVLYAANIDESELPEGGDMVARLRERVTEQKVVPVAAKLEAELSELEEQERAEFLVEMGLRDSGMQRLIAASYALLDLITFYTLANDKLQAWQAPRETPAPQAAGIIHTDMERGFIRAEVASCEDLLEFGSLAALREAGRLRSEGHDYRIQDGDVVQFLFKP